MRAFAILLCLYGMTQGSRAAQVSPGVSQELAERRAGQIRDLRYELRLEVPGDVAAPLRGEVDVDFVSAGGDIVLDFTGRAVEAVSREGVAVQYRVESEHIVVPGIAAGPVSLRIRFVASDLALNRQPEFFYSLFVPNRAATAFPCFDQPDLKARFRLKMALPAGWTGVWNGEGEEETKPISTYLFAFAAGKFQMEEAERGGRRLRFYHRETDVKKVAANRDAIFDLHAQALAWLEDYTQQPYPFGKFDFALVPSFQFGGMEHPGSIFYRASSLLLEPSATDAQKLARASLIAHETAHIWFGDLVTMRWFDDVWTKEVFANFMAAKIVEPSFPAIDHSLRFFLAHYPAAYEIDRSLGTHPIRQPLENLNDAASLYGPIIYQKAPVVMDQLERILGKETLRDGLREYLKTFGFANATWPELIAILDRGTERDLAAWSRRWVDEAERPKLRMRRVAGGWSIESRGKVWPQSFTLRSLDPASAVEVEVQSGTTFARMLESASWAIAAGDGYGYFALPRSGALALLREASRVTPERDRAAAWMSVWDHVEEGVLRPEEFLDAGMAAMAVESNELLAGRLAAWMSRAYWRSLSPERRVVVAPRLEALYWSRLEAAKTTSLRVTFFRAYLDIATTAAALERIEGIWGRKIEVAGIPFGEQDYMAMAWELALRAVPDSRGILDRQEAATRDPERKARFQFVRDAVDPDLGRRRAFFAKLREGAKRSREPWVTEGLGYLHHPLRAVEAEEFLAPGLEMLEEIRRTGGIFFPKAWLDATLAGHTSPAAYGTVREYLRRHPDLPARLRQKVLQASDSLRRSVTLRRVAPSTVRKK
jgi:aminopeptidase N